MRHVYYWSVAESLYDAGFERSVSWDIDLLGGYGRSPHQPIGCPQPTGLAGWPTPKVQA